MKVFISPHPDNAPFGIKRVVEALYKHLPEIGIEVVNSEAEADVVNVHATAFVETDKPIVYSSHGLYWADQKWPLDYLRANQAMIDYMKRSQKITAVSEWVGHAISRGILNRPVVIGHGVDTADWVHEKENLGYVLWNKARVDPVCNPEAVNELARRLPDVGFVSTFGEPSPNVQITGVVDHETMRDMVQKAGVYLSTARETFGIGTLEALAAGVPVVGWDFGGNREIVENGKDGYLVPYGDYDALTSAVQRALNKREKISRNIQETVDKWDWAEIIPRYAAVFRLAYEESQPKPVGVTVLVTAYNLDKYLADCLASVEAQTFQNWECLIVDDCSTDTTPEIAKSFSARDGRFKYIRPPSNLKLSGARNYGYKQSQGKYILPLDADDMLAEGALEVLSAALNSDPSIHIAYGHLDIVNEDGSDRRRNDWPFAQFNWEQQMSHLNQLPYSSMMRREVLDHSGGYRVRDYLAEDAALWCRVSSLGFRAKKVTDKPTLVYRLRPDSKSSNDRKEYGDGAFTAWYPWKVADSVQGGMQAVREQKRPNPNVVPFGAQGDAPYGCWPVWSHHDPLVSVIIPVGPSHEKYLIDALDSVLAQTFPFWEAVVVNDTGSTLDVSYAPWAKVVKGGGGIAQSRNIGIEAAQGHLLLFLDADDFLFPTAVEQMLKAYVQNDGAKYIYTDWYNITPGEPPSKNNAKPYDRTRSDGSSHPVTALVRREHAQTIGGFDEAMPGWEDWEFYIRMAMYGFCGARLPEALLVYRLHTGLRREDSLARKDESLAVLKERYADFFTGAKPMAKCCGGDTTILEVKRQLGLIESTPTVNLSRSKDGVMSVRVEYRGKSVGAVTISSVGGKQLSRPIRAGNNPLDRFHDVPAEDAKLLVESRLFRQVGGAELDLNQGLQMVPDLPPEPPAVNPVLPDIPVVAINDYKPEIAPLDPSAMTVAEIKSRTIGLSAQALSDMLEKEKGGQNRKSAVAYLEEMLADAERVESGPVK